MGGGGHGGVKPRGIGAVAGELVDCDVDHDEVPHDVVLEGLALLRGWMSWSALKLAVADISVVGGGVFQLAACWLALKLKKHYTSARNTIVAFQLGVF